jgi:hypothetical protein
VPPTAEVTQKPVDATVTGIEVKTFISGEVSWSSIGFSKAGVYNFKFHAQGELSGSKFAISSDTAILEVLPSGRPATLHILQEPGNAAPVSGSMVTWKKIRMRVRAGQLICALRLPRRPSQNRSNASVCALLTENCLQRYSSRNSTEKDIFVLQTPPKLQLRDSANNPIIGFRGTFEVRRTGGDVTTVLGVVDKMSFFAGGTQVTLPNLFFTTQVMRDTNLHLRFRSSCCSLLSQVSDDLMSSNLSLSSAPTGIKVEIQGHVNGSIVRAGDPFSIVATAVADDGLRAYGFRGNVVLDPVITSKDPAGLLTILKSGPLVSQAQDGVATFNQMVMRQLGNFEAAIIGFPVGYFVPRLQSAAAQFKSINGSGTTIAIVQQPGGASGGAIFASQPILQVVDQSGNPTVPLTTTSLTAQLQRAPGSAMGSSNGNLLGTVTVQCRDDTGLCTFANLHVDKTGRYLLAFSSSSSSLSNGVRTEGVHSAIFEIQIGAIATVISVQTPELSTGGIQFSVQPVAAVTDAGGNWVYDTSQQVRLSVIHSLYRIAILP